MPSLFASTLNIHDQLFLEGSELRFSGDSKEKIENFGTIETTNGDLIFVASHVENHGSIEVKNGIAALLGGRDILLKPSDLKHIYIKTDMLSDEGNIFASAFTHPEGDDHHFVRHTGKIHVENSDGTGGKVFLQADYVGLEDFAEIDVSHDCGLGEVWIGKGLNEVSPAKRVFLGKDASIKADALLSGNGGKVVLWSDEATFFEGTISATGGKESGDGGFVEVSGRWFEYNGFSDVSASSGIGGKLLLDPSDVLIASVGPFSAPVALANPTTWTALTLPNSPIVIDSAAIVLALGAGDVTINTALNFNFGNTGTITQSAAADIIWGSPFGLTLIANSNITINAFIQNSGSGPVILQAGGAITISAVAQDASVGVQNGQTTVTCNGDLILQGGTTRGSQIGYRTSPAPQTCTNAPLNVSCNNLSLLAGPSVGGAIIGHGIVDTAVPNDMSTVNCPITVNVAGNGLLRGGSGASMAKIGHGSYSLGSVLSNNQEGNITVSVGGGLTLQGALAGTVNGALIGHGSGTPALVPLGNLIGDITVSVGGNLLLQSVLGNNNRSAIGHYTHINSAAAVINDAIGDVTVTCGGDCSFIGGGNGTNHIFIGHHATRGFTGNYISNLHLTVHGNLSMNHQSDSQGSIGWSRFQVGIATEPNIIGEVAVIVSGNLTMTGSTGVFLSPNLRSVEIGYQTNRTAAPIPNPPTYVAVGGDIILDNQGGGGNGRYHLGIGGYGDVFVSAGRSIFLFGSQSLSTVRTYIGSTRINNNLTSAPLTRIFARDNIIAVNRVGQALLGFSNTINSVVPDYGFSADIRSGGDTQVASDIITNFNGFIFLQSDSPFAAGELWGYAGSNLTSVAGTALLAPVTNTAVLTGAVSGSSPSIVANALGGLRFDPSPLPGNVDLQTLNGSITLHSASFRQNTTAQNLVVGTGATDVGILTTNGNIEIWGSVPGDAYNNIIFNHPITMMNTTGSILAVANANMTVEAGILIQSTGNFVTLVVDNFFPAPPLIGPGQFISNAGAVINSGVGSPLRIFTARQQINLIDLTTLFNGQLFVEGPLFLNTNQEVWCTYFNTPIQGIPFTIFYKDCLQTILQQAGIIVDEFLTDLHPYDEHPGWFREFFVSYEEIDASWMGFKDPYLLRHRMLNLFNHPKTWTAMMNEGRLKEEHTDHQF